MRKEKISGRSTGFPEKRYANVVELTQDLGEKPGDFAKVQGDAYSVARCLAKMRLWKGLTQRQMAVDLGITQGTVSKIEAGPDSDLTLKILHDYSRVTGNRLFLRIGAPLDGVAAVTHHATKMKEGLEALAHLANRYDELEPEISRFFSEAFFRVLDIIANTAESRPNQVVAETSVELQAAESDP